MIRPNFAKATTGKDEKWLLAEKYGGVAGPEFEADKKRLDAGEPLAYVIGWQPFLGLKIHLDSRPLIPRPETEYWTEQLLAHVGRQTSNMGGKFLDLCAGSGAIGCAALKYLPEAEVYFGEINPAHEATILKNIRENKLDEARAETRIGDLFAPFAGMKFDVIAANPPYIPEGRELPESVERYEPRAALRAGEDGLALIRRIAEGLPTHLAEGGTAWIECDSSHAESARSLFEAGGLRSAIRTDQFEVPRVLCVQM